jgi:hypothetical protein
MVMFFFFRAMLLYSVKILVIALSRSGHHAIIHWIASQLPGKTLHHNNCNENLRPTEAIQEYGSGELVNDIYNFEDFDIRGYKEVTKEMDFDQLIFVMRDPFNWIASSLKKGNWIANLKGLYLQKFNETSWYCPWFARTMPRYEMYLQYAAQVERREDFVDRDFLCINYNRWVEDENYRRALAGQLDFEFTDAGKDFVPQFGGGSSFGDRDVLNRWENYKDDAEYWELLDERFIDFSRRYFGFDPMQRFEQGSNPF